MVHGSGTKDRVVWTSTNLRVCKHGADRLGDSCCLRPHHLDLGIQSGIVRDGGQFHCGTRQRSELHWRDLAGMLMRFEIRAEVYRVAQEEHPI